jgi:hypothetical protein
MRHAGRRGTPIEFWWYSQKVRVHYDDLDAGGRLILKWILRWGGMDWIDLAQNRDQWRALVKTVMNFGFHKMLQNS